MSTNRPEKWKELCQEMVATQIERRGVRDSAVLEAMRQVPRHRFVGAQYVARAYEDTPLPIGHRQTISQPYMVARMTELLRLSGRRTERILEIGTGCGYQTAVLARLAGQVYSIEIVPELFERTRELLANLPGVHLRQGDGYAGWPEAAPFDGILVAAAPAHIPPPLREQLAPGGRLVIPVGDDEQRLLVIERTPTGYREESILPVRFVPMTGTARPDPKRKQD